MGSVGPRNEPPEGQDLPLQSLDPQPLKPGEIDYHMIDEYEVRCPEKTRAVFMDMYHCGADAPNKAAVDFKIE